MQLLDPSNIRRSSDPLGAKEIEKLTNLIQLQEEFKEVTVENELLRERTADNALVFKRIEENREKYILSLQDRLESAK